MGRDFNRMPRSRCGISVKSNVDRMIPPATKGLQSSESTNPATIEAKSAATHSVPAIRWNVSRWLRFGALVFFGRSGWVPSGISVSPDMKAVPLPPSGLSYQLNRLRVSRQSLRPRKNRFFRHADTRNRTRSRLPILPVQQVPKGHFHQRYSWQCGSDGYSHDQWYSIRFLAKCGH